MRTNPLATYATIGIICGGTAGIAQAVHHGSSLSLGLILATLSGGIAGSLYGYIKLRRAAKR